MSPDMEDQVQKRLHQVPGTKPPSEADLSGAHRLSGANLSNAGLIEAGLISRFGGW
jgi:hypothetical protein